jgi:hypothetical protein
VLRARRRSSLTMKHVRRLLEGDMGLTEGQLDGSEHKAAIKTQVDQARSLLGAPLQHYTLADACACATGRRS